LSPSVLDSLKRSMIRARIKTIPENSKQTVENVINVFRKVSEGTRLMRIPNANIKTIKVTKKILEIFIIKSLLCYVFPYLHHNKIKVMSY